MVDGVGKEEGRVTGLVLDFVVRVWEQSALQGFHLFAVHSRTIARRLQCKRVEILGTERENDACVRRKKDNNSITIGVVLECSYRSNAVLF